MSFLVHFLRRQRRRLSFYHFIDEVLLSVFLFSVSLMALRAFSWIVALVWAPIPFESSLRLFIGLSVAGFFIFRCRRILATHSLSQVAAAVESQSPFFKQHPEWKSEFVSAAEFIDTNSSEDFQKAHILRMAKMLPNFAIELRPSLRTGISAGIVFVFLLCFFSLLAPFRIPVPQSLRAWTPGNYEILFPYPDAPWIQESGALQGVKGSRVRFQSPKENLLATYVFLRTADSSWSAVLCRDVCEIELNDSLQYAVGTLISRSSLFPAHVYEDESPKSALFAEVKGEWVPAVVLEVLNQETLPLELVASDDLRLKKVEVLHRFENKEEILETFSVSQKHFKSGFTLSMKGWKGGEHEVLIRPFDDFQSSVSTPLRILFNDENSMREKRIQDLNSLIIEWTHILADLIDSKLDGEAVEGLSKRLKSFEYPEAESDTLIAGYINELKLLSKRIESWLSSGAPMHRSDDLIARVETQILYGLSLVFQEKAGDLKSTGQDLAESQKDLAKMLEQIKDGKMKLDSKFLEEAFKKLADKLRELQEKISSLPQGPQDEMINREALEAQAQESEDLAKRIEEIRKQAEAGDEKGALREMESLLNQLSILTKEMERGLDQWQGNLDQGAIQKAQEFAKKLEEIKKSESEINEKTKVLKEKLEKLEEQNAAVFTKKDAEELKKLQEQIKQMEAQQQSTGEKFQEARKDFDTALEGTEWKQLFRSEEAQSLENEIGERFLESEQGLKQQQLHEADAAQKESIDLLNKAQQQQKQMQKQVQQLQKQEQAKGGLRNEKIEIKSTEAKGEKERRRRIMESLKQRVGDKFQQSHERYFEELLQR